MARATPVLHRDDPDKEALVGHVKVTRTDWLNAAREVLVANGVAQVKILTLALKLDVSRSSFYWYFGSRADLLTALLDDWEDRNTAPIVRHCDMPSNSITQALCHFFRCFVDDTIFDPHLDFAIREWARRDAFVRGRIDAADAARLDAVTAMFARHGYRADEADIRARILYFMQIGYHALELREPIERRLTRAPGFLEHFTGRSPSAAEIEEFAAFAQSVASHSSQDTD